MYNDDFWDKDDDDDMGYSIEELLFLYQQLKSGDSKKFLEEEDYTLLIEHFYHNNFENEALEVCDMAQTYHPFSTDILLLKSEILFQGQKYGQALKTLDQLDTIEGNIVEAVLLRSDIYIAQLKFDLSLHLLEHKASTLEGSDKIEILHELVEVYDECEDFDAVFNTLKRILDYDFRNDEALHKISFWADFASKNEESIALHLAIIEKNPYSAIAWFNLGAAYQGLKQYIKAIDAYEYCLAIDEKFEAAYRNIADAYIRLRWYNKAIESLEKNLELGKPEDVIFEALGHCYDRLKQYDKARVYFRKAIQLNPADDSIFYKIGEAYYKEQQFDKALKAYSSAMQLNKENANYYIAIGNTLMELDAGADALICYLNAVQLKPFNKTSWVALIKGLYINKLYDEGIHQLGIARENCGEKSDFDYYHAACLFELGKSKEALIYLENGLTQAPNKVKLFIDLNPDNLQRKAVADLISSYKRKKK